MSRYASNTTVSVGRTKAEIEDLLIKHGAEQFVAGWDGFQAVLGFVFNGRHIRFALKLPDKNDRDFTMTRARRNKRSPEEAMKAWEQACRSRWRALLLVIKAKLEAVEVGISTVELEFLPWTVVPGRNETVGELIGPQMEKAISGGYSPKLLLGDAPRERTK
ncbi:MAG: hypothetical protein H6830_04500 [Planctomycetes bacterium]|nr:hypothetical protein [Planctomycetota bacterium]MCB9910496.1 hypothetical protein [Planctomycetota bacterium]MCB9912622.1 hypothetical protein [Planctomycetota bacterium]HRV80250.1 hypothetical protein [Planctomycetota bacterium]